MIKINRLRTEIISDKSDSISDVYGFDYKLVNGLNIIAGHNSRGKTTINSCIYYALGMEELLGGHGEKALDKALKEEFEIKLENDEEINHLVFNSKVLLEIQSNDKIVTIIRYIKSTDSNQKPNVLHVYNSTIEDIEYVTHKQLFYVNGRGNNDNDHGFYMWLAEFMNIRIPYVSNTSRTDNYSPLYLQVIFSTLLIEQTKGWSDFFATMPYFGIPNAKQKNVEFLLNLNELSLSTQKDVLSKIKSGLSEEWNKTIKSFELIASQYNGFFNVLPNVITTDKLEIDKINFIFAISEKENISLKKYIETLTEKYKSLENIPIPTIGNNREDVILQYQKQNQEYSELQEYIKDFEDKLSIEKIQLSNLKNQLNRISQEIKDQDSLKKVFSENIVNKEGNHCPTCSQYVTTDLISSNNINIPKLSIEENIAFLKGQKKLIETTINSLESILTEKKLLLEYFNESLRQKESLIKSLSRDLIADDRAFSESDVLLRLQLEKKIEDLQFIESKLTNLKDELIELANKYHNNIIQNNNLNVSEIEDEDKLVNFEKNYKRLLHDFGYDSNELWKISINRKEPFKYFPIYKGYKDDKIPQSIRINSSASDFVRNIWAYSLSLLTEGSNHPGLLIFDEPGQHRTNIKSLKSLFKECSSLIDKQVIIFTSVDKKINEKEILEIKVLTEDLGSDNYKLIELDEENKAIHKLEMN